MKFLSIKLIFILVVNIALFAQEQSRSQPDSAPTGSDLFGGDPFGGLSVDSLPPPILEIPRADIIPSDNNDSTLQQNLDNQNPLEGHKKTQSKLNPIRSSDLDSPVQNAIIEGIQITAEKSEIPDEKVISGYFIFRDKPSSYFYETKLREKKIVFEFNDTKTGSSPVPSVSESPIKGFTITTDKVDANKDVKGLKPEYHNLIRVIFDLEGVPEIHVNDEYSIITFSFKWTNNPQMLSKYTLKDKTPKIVLWSSLGVGGLGLGALAAFLLVQPAKTPPDGPISTDDLPMHQQLH